MITPTVGRIVWYIPEIGQTEMTRFDATCPMAAGVCFVHGASCVNLDITDHNGKHHTRNSVPLLQDEDAKPEGGHYAFWMPFQKGQAAKTEALEAAKPA